MRVNSFVFLNLGNMYFISIPELISKSILLFNIGQGETISIEKIIKSSYPIFLGEMVINYNKHVNRIEVVDLKDTFRSLNSLEEFVIYCLPTEIAEEIPEIDKEGLPIILKNVADFEIPVFTSFISIAGIMRCGVEAFHDPATALRAASNLRMQNLTSFTMMFLDNIILDDTLTQSSSYARIFDLYCDSHKYHSSILKNCYLAIEKVGSKYFVLSNMATVYFNLGELSIADSYYLKAAEDLVKSDIDVNTISLFNQGFISWSGLDGLDVECDNHINKDHKHYFAAETMVECVHLVSTDPVYFRQFGKKLIKTSLENGFNGFVLHLNLVNSDPEVEGQLAIIQENHPKNFSYSVEILPEGGISPAYYASSRYIHLPMVSRRYKAPIFVTDIDMRVSAPWRDTLEKYSSNDMCLHSSKEVDLSNYLEIRGRPWSIPAGYFFVNNTPSGVLFGEYISSYIRSNYKSESRSYTNWVIDQVAIRRALDMLIRDQLEFTLGRILRNFMTAPRKSFQTKSEWAKA